jgi:hypothetical protein
VEQLEPPQHAGRHLAVLPLGLLPQDLHGVTLQAG